MLWLCLLAVFALGAITAAGASAKLPEWGECREAEHENAEGETEYGVDGRYTDANCRVLAKGKGQGEARIYDGTYEWLPVESESGKIRNPTSTSATFETAAGYKIECAQTLSSSSFKLHGPFETKTPLWIFEDCASEGQPCTTISIGSEPGVISNQLAWLEEDGRGWQGHFGLLEGKGGAEPAVGLEFSSSNTKTGEAEPFFVPISCDGAIGTVLIGGDKEPGIARHGNNSFIGSVSPVNEMEEEFTLKYEENGGVPAIEHFEKGKKAHSLEAFVHNEWEPVAIKATLKFRIGPLELRATHPGH